MTSPNQNPEQIARDQIDKRLSEAGWIVQNKKEIDFGAGLGIAVREYQTDVGPADYALFVDRRAVGVIEAKPKDWGVKLTTVEEQSAGYAAAKLKWVNNKEPLPFVYESTGLVTRFTDGRDPKPRSREVFTFHRPETMAEWLTSLYQVTLRGKVVETETPKKKRVKRWFYIDIRKSLDPSVDREEAIVGVPEDRIIRTDFGRTVELDLSTPQAEYASLMYPVSKVFDWDKWQDGFDAHWRGDQHEAVRDEFRSFKREVLENFKYYRVPVIALDRSTSKEAVCVV